MQRDLVRALQVERVKLGVVMGALARSAGHASAAASGVVGLDVS